MKRSLMACHHQANLVPAPPKHLLPGLAFYLFSLFTRPEAGPGAGFKIFPGFALKGFGFFHAKQS